jgi:uncharacterized protein YbjT (DUF2867 family)
VSNVVLVVGASGKTGQRIVEQLLGLGRSVRAFSRHASQLPSRPQLERVDGDVLDAAAVRAAVRGVTGVIVCLGPAADAAPDLCERGTTRVIAAMREANVRRLVCITGAMIGLPRAQLGWVYRRIQSSVPPAALTDRRRQEALVIDSGLDWTLLRPTRLTDGPASGRLATGLFVVGAMAHVSRSDVARFAIESLVREDRIGTAHTLARASVWSTRALRAE